MNVENAMTRTYHIFTCSKPPIEALEKKDEVCSKLTVKTPERSP